MTPIHLLPIPTTRRLAVLLIAAAIIVRSTNVLATTVEAASLDVDHGVTTLAVESPRPIATAVQTLVSRYGVVITYEDPRYAYAGDLQDVANLVRKETPRLCRGGSRSLTNPEVHT
jgi:hypothetical protein